LIYNSNHELSIFGYHIPNYLVWNEKKKEKKKLTIVWNNVQHLI